VSPLLHSRTGMVHKFTPNYTASHPRRKHSSQLQILCSLPSSVVSAMAQVVGRQPLIAVVLERPWSDQRGIFGRQSGTGPVSPLPSTSGFPQSVLFHQCSTLIHPFNSDGIQVRHVKHRNAPLLTVIQGEGKSLPHICISRRLCNACSVLTGRKSDNSVLRI